MDNKDLEILSKLNNPDDASDEGKYAWDENIQQQILGLLLRDKFFLLQALTLIKPLYFVQDAHSKICKILYSYFNEYGVLPNKDYIKMVIQEDIGDKPILAHYIAELDVVCEAYEPGLDHREFLLDKITEFAKIQATKEATSEMIALLKKKNPNRWSLIREVWQHALQVDRNVDIGLDYFANVQDRYDRLLKEDHKERFTTGFASIDKALDGGLSRGEIGAFAAASGVGKSNALIQCGANNLMAQRKVLYVSLEMSEEKIALRFDAMLTVTPISQLKVEQKKVIDILNNRYFAHSPDRQRLKIKQFSASAADVATIRAYMSQIALYGFVPDLVIVDYVGELRDYPNMKTYESRERHVRELRSLAVEFDVCIFTAIQLNRAGKEVVEEGGFADDSNLADSTGQVRPLDALWTINQNMHQKKANVGTIYVAKHRNGQSRFTIYYEQFDTLRMKEISNQTFKIRLSNIENASAESVNTDFKPNRSSGE